MLDCRDAAEDVDELEHGRDIGLLIATQSLVPAIVGADQSDVALKRKCTGRVIEREELVSEHRRGKVGRCILFVCER